MFVWEVQLMALIIIADDDELVVDLVRLALQAEGHVVGALSDGTDVKKVVELKQPDLVILDCSMPERSGVEALRDIRGTFSIHKTPVLMLTARGGQTDEEIARLSGANDYLRKPFDVDQLVVCVTALLKKGSDGREAGQRPLLST
jgi:DNA-binding response OmpR family regulator